MMKKLLFALLILCVSQGTMAQLISLGLTDETNIEKAIKEGYVNNTYIPKLDVAGEYIYASTVQGLYRYNIHTIGTAEWEKMPMADEVVRDFCVNEDTLLVLTKKVLYVSTDGGKTSIEIPFDSIAKERPNGELLDIAVDTENMNQIFIAYRGLSYTTDRGKTWETVNTNLGNMVFPLDGICYHPHISGYLIGYCNQTVIDECQLLISNDGGVSWSQIDGIGAPKLCFDIAFHPTDNKTMIAYGSILYAISNDGGESWTPKYAENDCSMAVNAWKVIYDVRDPNILYAATMTGVHRSVDGGLTWHEYYSNEKIEKIRNLAIYNNMLFIYAQNGGIYLLDVDAVDNSVAPVVNDKGYTPYYDLLGRPIANPTRGIYIKDGKKVAIE